MPGIEVPMRRVPLSPLVVFCNSDSYIFFPATPWLPAAEAEQVRDALEARNMPASSAMTLAIGMQVANTPDSPDTAVALASSRVADGHTFPVAFVDKTSTTGARQLVRFGYLVKNSTASDTTVRLAWAAGAVELKKG